MTSASDIPVKSSATSSDASIEPGVIRSSKRATEAVTPTLAAYFSGKKVPPYAFIKALKTKSIKRFDQADEAQALELMEKNDADGDRLWMLLSQSKLPEVINRWIWKAAQERLMKVIGPSFDPVTQSAADALDALRAFLVPHLNAAEGNKRRAAETWVRIGNCWLMERLSLDAWLVADQMSQTLFRNSSDARRVAIAAIRRGRPAEFKNAIAIAGLSRTIIDNARGEAAEEKRRSSVLKDQLENAKIEIDKLQSKVAELDSEVARIAALQAKAQSQLETERMHWGHDLLEARAGQQALLRERVAPLLSDAVDALEIEPPAPGTALRRLKNVISIISGAQQ